MELYPVDPLGLHQPDPVDAGWARSLTRGPRTVSEVLGEALQRMNAEDEAEAYAADPIAYIRAGRARTTAMGAPVRPPLISLGTGRADQDRAPWP